MNKALYTLAIILFSISYSALAQNAIYTNANSKDGKYLIEHLRDSRYAFNKDLIKSRVPKLNALPKSAYIFNNSGVQTFSFDGVKFVVKDKNVISIDGISVSSDVLATITEKLVTLDKLQFLYSEKSNQEYSNPDRNLQFIFNTDRQFFSTLIILGSTVRDIAALAKAKTSKIGFELGIAKMRKPNIDRSILTDEFQTSSLTSK